ncbi:MAG: hypothetical protein IKD58_03745 [Loktanella sp.]|nr:hypothetical protein [Loktanella sp.]
MKRQIVVVASLVVSFFSATATLAQNFSSPGGDWGSGWGFQSATDRSLAIQQAQAIRSATTQNGPSTVVNNTSFNTNDNRSGYIDATGQGAVYGNLDIHTNGDKIGQNTNSIGAMNTGTTNIEVKGNNNVIDATNAADSNGCIDGSVTLTDTPFASMETASGIDITMDFMRQTGQCIK